MRAYLSRSAGVQLSAISGNAAGGSYFRRMYTSVHVQLSLTCSEGILTISAIFTKAVKCGNIIVIMAEASHPIEYGPPLEQPTFYKNISDFEPGDRIWVSGNALETPFEGERRVATVLGVAQVGTFGNRASVLLDGEADIASTPQLDLSTKFELASLDGQDRVFVQAQYIRPGHVLNSWRQRATVQSVDRDGEDFVLTCFDTGRQEPQQIRCKATAEYALQIAEPSEEKRQWRARRLAAHLLPPIEIHPGEDPQSLARRIMRQMEEWTDD